MTRIQAAIAFLLATGSWPASAQDLLHRTHHSEENSTGLLSQAYSGHTGHLLVEFRGMPQLGFYLIQWGNFQSFTENGQRHGISIALRRVEESHAFGPWHSGIRRPLAVGSSYLVLPICDGRPSWERRSFKQVLHPRDDPWVDISC